MLAFACYDLGRPISARILLEEAFAQDIAVVKACAGIGGWEGENPASKGNLTDFLSTDNHMGKARLDLMAFAFRQATESGFIEIVDGLPEISSVQRPHEPSLAEIDAFIDSVDTLDFDQ